MDKRYYYRMLGLQEGASAAKIEAAYKEKIRKLNSADYADDPEYVHRKKYQLKEAYHVLTGRTAPISTAEKERRFERFKDALDGGEDSVKEERRKKSTVAKRSKSRYRKSETNGAEIGKKIFAVIFFIIWGLGFFGGILGFIFEGAFDNFEDNFDRLSAIDQNAVEYDYASYLDDSTVDIYGEYVDWESEAEYDGIWDTLDTISISMEIGGFENIVEYETGDEDFYYNNSDFECSKKVIEFMQAPSFKEVGGCRNLYTDQIIFTYDDYLMFISDVAMNQTGEILGEY